MQAQIHKWQPKLLTQAYILTRKFNGKDEIATKFSQGYDLNLQFLSFEGRLRNLSRKSAWQNLWQNFFMTSRICANKCLSVKPQCRSVVQRGRIRANAALLDALVKPFTSLNKVVLSSRIYWLLSICLADESNNAPADLRFKGWYCVLLWRVLTIVGRYVGRAYASW
jgi:hypothetical protein